MAGLTVAAFAVPEDMAYASLAGLAPQHGLYASLISMLVYACVGTSRQLSYGVTSALSIMVAGSLGAMAFSSPDQYLAAAGFVAVMAGAMAIVAWALRLGVIANFVSESVLTGFSAGAALFIASSQISKLFGIEGVSGNFFDRIANVLRNLGETSGTTLALGLVSLAVLLVLEELLPRLPAALLVVLGAITVSWAFELAERGVHVAGSIPSGLPTPAIPTVDSSQALDLVSLAFGVFLLSYIEGVSVARTFAARHRYPVDPNQELLANGLTNVASGLFRGYSVGGSMSRSAVADNAGAKTPAAGAVAAILLGVVLLFLTAPFSYLPEATLAAIVFVAVRHLVDISAFRRLWTLSQPEFVAALATFGGVLVFGMLEGIIIGVIVTFVGLLIRSAAPQVPQLGRMPGSAEYVDVSHWPDATVRDDVLVMRSNSGWFYANAGVIRDELMNALASRDPAPQLVVIDMATAPLLDLGAIEILTELSEHLANDGIALRLANLYARNHELLTKAHEGMAAQRPHLTVDEAIESWECRSDPARTSIA